MKRVWLVWLLSLGVLLHESCSFGRAQKEIVDIEEIAGLTGVTEIHETAWSPDNRLAIRWVDGDSERVSVWDGSKETDQTSHVITDATIVDTTSWITGSKLTWSADNRLAIEWNDGNNGNKVSVWDGSGDAQEVAGLTNVVGVRWSSDNQLAILWLDGTAGRISVWDGAGSAQEVTGITNAVTARWSSDNQLAIVWLDGSTYKVSVWDGSVENIEGQETVKPAQEITGSMAGIYAIEWSSDNQLVIRWLDGSTHTVSVWNGSTLDNVSGLTNVTEIHETVWSSDNQLAIRWKDDQNAWHVSVWDGSVDEQNGRVAQDITSTQTISEITKIIWSSDNQLAIGLKESSIYKVSVWNGSGNAQEISGLSGVDGIAWSPDNQLAVIWEDRSDGSMYKVSVLTGKYQC